MYHGDTDAALHDLRGWMRAGWQAVLVFEGHGSAERAVERLAQADIAARFVTEVGSVPRVVQVTTGRLDAGLIAPSLSLAFLSESDLTGQRGRAGARQREDAVAAAQRDRPARARSPATTSCTSSTVSVATSRWCGARSTAASANT